MFGVPPGLRPQVWETALGLAPMDEGDVRAFECLCVEVQQQQLVVDTCICDDLGSVLDSEHFFLFEDMLRWACGPAWGGGGGVMSRCCYGGTCWD